MEPPAKRAKIDQKGKEEDQDDEEESKKQKSQERLSQLQTKRHLLRKRKI